jgi:hypothetical protein
MGLAKSPFFPTEKDAVNALLIGAIEFAYRSIHYQESSRHSLYVSTEIETETGTGRTAIICLGDCR